MKHNLYVSGFAFGLRPIALEDAEFVVQVRSDPERMRFVHPIPSSIEAQRVYLQEYFARVNDYYFVVVRHHDHFREGLIGLYDIELKERTSECGRWILRPGSLAAVESALRIYEVAFDHLHLRKVYIHTVVDNHKVVAFQERCGLKPRAVQRAYYKLNGSTCDAFEYVLDRCDWPRVRQLLEPEARMMARRLERRLAQADKQPLAV